MASFNRVLLMGNLTRNPEIRYTPSGTAVADLGLAVNETYKNKAGETVENTVFVDIVVWGRQAETAAEYLHKGAAVFVEGRLQLDQWESQQGEKRSKLRVRADRVNFIGGTNRSGGASASEDEAPSVSDSSVPSAAEQDGFEDDNVPF